MLLYLDPPYYNTFDKYTYDGFDQNDFIEYLEDVTNRANWKVILSNSNDIEGIIAENDQINLPRIMTVSVKDFTNTTKPTKNRVEIIATNLSFNRYFSLNDSNARSTFTDQPELRPQKVACGTPLVSGLMLRVSD